MTIPDTHAAIEQSANVAFQAGVVEGRKLSGAIKTRS
jgi:hypothetical protein